MNFSEAHFRDIFQLSSARRNEAVSQLLIIISRVSTANWGLSYHYVMQNLLQHAVLSLTPIPSHHPYFP